MLVDVWLGCWFKGLNVRLVILVCECVVGFFRIICISLFWLIVHIESFKILSHGKKTKMSLVS